MEMIKKDDLYVRGIGKLCDALTKANIAYEVYHDLSHHGYIVFFPGKENRKGEVILYDYSSGHLEYGLFVGYAAMSKNDDDVYVFGTIEELVDYAKENGFVKGK